MNILNEFDIWKEIFYCNDLQKIDTFIKLVIKDEDTRRLVKNEIVKLRNLNLEKDAIVNIKVKIAEESLGIKSLESLAKEIVDEIEKNLNKKNIKIIS